MNRSFILVVLLLSLVIAGCLQKADMYATIRKENVSYEAIQLADTNTCGALVCQEKKSFFGFGSSVNLTNGKCNISTYYFDFKDQASLNASLEAFNKLATRQLGDDTSKPYIRPFMFGAGNSYSAVVEAQTKCNGTLGFAVLDYGIIGSPLQQISKDDLSSMECLLGSDMIPIIAYSNSTGEYSSSLAKNLSGVGPVVLAPGYGYGTLGVQDPSSHFSQIKSVCSNCLTLAAVKSGDNSTLQRYQSNGAMSGIDFVGIIVNTSEIPSCDSRVVESAIKNFTRNVVTNFKKPSIIVNLYAPEGMNTAGNCNWTASSLSGLYEFITLSIPDLSTVGLIGFVAPDQLTASNISLNGWFYNCQIYYNSTDPVVATPAVYSLAGDTMNSLCTRNLNTRILTHYTPPDDYNFTLSTINQTLSCGSTCLNITSFPVYGAFTQSECSAFRLQIRHFADQSKFDPTVVMALISAGGYLPGQKIMRPLQPHCACDSYTNETKDICCGVQTLGYYNNIARQSFSDNSADSTYKRTYLSVFGYMYGDNEFNSELAKVKDGSGSENPTVNDILSKMIAVRNECGICKQ